MDIIIALRKQKNCIDHVLDMVETGRVNDGMKILRTLRADISYDLSIEEARAKFVKNVDKIVSKSK